MHCLYINLLYVLSVSNETFAETLKVVDKPSKVIN